MKQLNIRVVTMNIYTKPLFVSGGNSAQVARMGAGHEHCIHEPYMSNMWAQVVVD